MASTSEAIKEILVKKSVDFAGRVQTYTFYNTTLGKTNCTNFTTSRGLYKRKAANQIDYM